MGYKTIIPKAKGEFRMNNQNNIVDYKEIGQRVRKLRRDKNITQDQLAEIRHFMLIRWAY